MRRSPCHQSWAEQLNAPITRSARFIPSSPPPTPQSSPSSPLPWFLTAPASPYLGETQPPSQPPPETMSEESAGESAAGTLTAESESTAEPATPFEPEPESLPDEPQPIIDLTGDDDSDVDLSTLAEQARSLAEEAGAEVLDQREEEEQERMLQREERWRDEDQQAAADLAAAREAERQARLDDLEFLDDTQ